MKDSVGFISIFIEKEDNGDKKMRYDHFFFYQLSLILVWYMLCTNVISRTKNEMEHLDYLL